MGRASLHGLAKGPSTGSGQVPTRPRERHGRLSAGLGRPAGPAPASSPPSGFRLPRLARAWRAAACALAAAFALGAAFALLLGAGPAGAQTSVELVSNHGQFFAVNRRFSERSAQAFTTGSDAAKYVLTSVVFQARARSAYTVTASIHSNSSGNPGTSLGTLTAQGDLTHNHRLVHFQAGGNGIELDANTTYFVKVDGTGESAFTTTTSNAEDSGAAAGWSIADASTINASESVKIAIHGYAVAVNAGKDVTVRTGARVVLDGKGSPNRSVTYAWTQTGGPTVTLDDPASATPAFVAPSVSSRTDLTFSLTVSDGTDMHTDTVTVTVLPSRVKSASVNGSTLSVTFDTALDATSKPLGSAFTVTARKAGASRTIAGTGASVSISGSTVTATLSAAVAADERLTVRYDRPASGAVLKDSGGGALPSFPDRPAGNVAGDSTGPGFASATANGNTLTITFDEALAESVPAGNTFHRSVDDGNSSVSSTNVSLSGRTATVTFSTAVEHDDSVRVAFSVANDENLRIKDLSGNDAGSFVFQTVTNNTPPAFSSASVNGSALTVTFDGALDGSSEPAASAFTVKATRGGTERAVALADTDPVAVSGSTVVLTLAEAVLPAAVDTAVTVAYTAPATGKLRDADNAKLPVTGFGDTKTVTNATPADTQGPQFVSATMNRNTLTITFDEALDETQTPAPTTFQRIAGNNGFIGNSVSISGRTVTLTFSQPPPHLLPVLHGVAFTVEYNPLGESDAAKRLKDLSGNLVAAFTGQNAKPVTNNTPPAFSSASVNGSALTITFDGALDGSSMPAASAFTVKATRGGTERAVALADTDPVAVSGSTVVLTLAEAVLPAAVDTAVTVAYTAPATGKLQDADNAKLPVTGFGDTKTVTNDTPADTTAPAFASATANGNTVTITFDEALNESVPAGSTFTRLIAGGGTFVFSTNVSLSGRTATATFATAVEHEDSVSVAYAVANDENLRIKDLSGNDAGSFGFQTATNNTPPAFESASVNGSALTVTFDGALDEDAVPAKSAFTVKATRGGTETTVALAHGNAVDVDGAEVTLVLAEAVLPADTVTVAYAAPATGAKLQDADNAKLPVTGFDGTKTVTNDTPADTNAPAFASASVNGNILTITFDEALDGDSVSDADAFTVTAGGTAVDLAATNPVGVEGSAVTLTLAAAVAAGQSVKVAYDSAEAGTGTLRDLAGNEAPGFTAKDADNRTPAPETRIASVAVVSAPTIDADDDGTAETYGRGEVIRVKVTWSADVLWDVSAAGAAMAVDLDVGGTARTAALATGGAASGQARELSFEYTVVQADADADGVTVTRTVAHDLVVLSGGATLEDTHGRDASRTHAALSAGAGHKVDGSRTPAADTAAPAVTAAAVDAETGRTVTLTFDKDLKALSGAPLDLLRKWGLTVVGAYVEGVRIPGLAPERIEIAGRTLTLHLRSQYAAQEILPGREIAVGYRAALAEKLGAALRGANGEEVAAFTRKMTRAGATAPLLESAAVAGTKLTLTFDGELDPASAPAGRRFYLRADDPYKSFRLIYGTGVARVSGKTVAVTLASAVGQDEEAWLFYQRGDDARPLRGASPSAGVPGPVARDFNGFIDTTVYDRTAPKLVSAVAAASAVSLYYDEPLDADSEPAAADYEVFVGSTKQTPTHAAVSASGVVLSLGGAVTAGATMTVTYTAGSNPVMDPAGNRAANLSRHTVDNRGPTNGEAPALKSGSDVPKAYHGELTLTFDKPMNPQNVPAAGAFTLSQRTGHREGYVPRTVTSVAVRGDKVVLGLSVWAFPCTEPFTVTYTKPGGVLEVIRRLRSVWLVEAAGFEEQPVTIGGGCRLQWMAGARTGSVVLRGKRPFAKDVEPQKEWFTVSATGGPVTVTSAAWSPDDPHELKLGVSRDFTADETVTVSYRRPHGAAGLWDVDGNQLADITDRPVANEAAEAPAVAVTLASDPGDDATYAAGDAVRVAVTFGEAVDVDTAGGTPRLKLDLGGDDGAGERWAAYESGSGTETLTFAWTAAAPDESAAGVAVLADTLEPNGGTIRSAATQAEVALGHPGTEADPAHRVDAVAPELLRGEIDGATVTLWFSEALDPDSTGGQFLMGIQTSETASLGCNATGAVSIDGATATIGLGRGCPPAQAGLTARNYVKYLRHAEGHDGSFRDLAGNLLTPDGDAGIGLYVQIDLENVTGKTAAVTGAEVVTGAGSDGAYAVGETVEAAVTFDAPVTVGTADGAPTLALIANGGIRRAAYASGSGTERLVFAWRVGEADGPVAAPVRVAASGLKLNGGTIASAAGKPAALGFGEAPGVTAVSVGTQEDGRWETGDTVEAALSFAEPVTVEGAPSVGLVLEGAIRRAVYAAGSGTEALTFRYTLVRGDGPWDRAAVAGNSLRLGGGSIVSAGGGLAAALGHGGTGASGEEADPPSVTGVTVVSDAGSDATYGLGERIRVRVAFSEAVAVTGSPGIAIDMDPAEWGEKRAVYERGSGTDALVFVHEVVEPNLSRQGIAVLADTLALHGGATIRSAATQTDAALGHAGSGHDPAHKVDWRLAPAGAEASSSGPPSVTGVEVVSDAGSDSTYLLGDTIRVRLAFSEAVRVTGTPKLSIDMDPAEWGEKRAAFEGGAGTAALALTFAWTVVEPNWSPRGIAVLADSLALDGGTIVSAATGEAAALGHAGRDHDPAHKVDWRPALSVADARAREGVDEAVVFEVSLDRAFTGASHSVTVDYATADGTATAGEDYTATTGTLTFAAGERVKTVSVPILDDGHDEGHETFLLRLSNVAGAREGDLEATGTIENTDKMPKAWLARFGRTVAEQVVDSVQARLDAPRTAGAQATLGGQALPSWAPGSGSAAGPGAGAANDDEPAMTGFGGDASARRDAERLTRWLAGTEGRDDEAGPEDRSMTGREALSTTAFSLTAAPEDGGPSMALWGRGASSSFSGPDGPLTVNGEVVSATLGADWRSGRWLLGAMVKHSIGEGDYSGDGGSGDVESTLTGIYPYAAVDLSARLRAWAAAGLGEGTLKLTPKNPGTGEDDPALETDMSLGMAALGAKGNLVEPAGGSGFRLDVEADAFWVRTSSEKAPGLAAAEADVTRMRLGLDGGHVFALPGSGSGTDESGGTLEPTFELGLRHDGGDAETGWGVDIGGGLRWNDPALGLSAEVSGRGLIAHEAAGFKDRGVSGSLAWDPDPASARGPSLSLTQTLGAQAAGGADALLGRQTLAELAANDNGFGNRRLELRLGYGVPAFGDRFTSTPELGAALSDAAREYRLGWRLGLVPGGPSSFELGVEATRTEPANDAGTAPEHGVELRLEARF